MRFTLRSFRSKIERHRSSLQADMKILLKLKKIAGLSVVYNGNSMGYRNKTDLNTAYLLNKLPPISTTISTNNWPCPIRDLNSANPARRSGSILAPLSEIRDLRPDRNFAFNAPMSEILPKDLMLGCVYVCEFQVRLLKFVHRRFDAGLRCIINIFVYQTSSIFNRMHSIAEGSPSTIIVNRFRSTNSVCEQPKATSIPVGRFCGCRIYDEEPLRTKVTIIDHPKILRSLENDRLTRFRHGNKLFIVFGFVVKNSSLIARNRMCAGGVEFATNGREIRKWRAVNDPWSRNIRWM